MSLLKKTNTPNGLESLKKPSKEFFLPSDAELLSLSGEAYSHVLLVRKVFPDSKVLSLALFPRNKKAQTPLQQNLL